MGFQKFCLWLILLGNHKFFMLSSLMKLEVVIMTSYGAPNDKKVGIITTLVLLLALQCLLDVETQYTRHENCFCYPRICPRVPFMNLTLTLKTFNLTLIPAWVSNYICYKIQDENIYPLPNIKSATIEVWEWTNNFIKHFTGHVITYPCKD